MVADGVQSQRIPGRGSHCEWYGRECGGYTIHHLAKAHEIRVAQRQEVVVLVVHVARHHAEPALLRAIDAGEGVESRAYTHDLIGGRRADAGLRLARHRALVVDDRGAVPQIPEAETAER